MQNLYHTTRILLELHLKNIRFDKNICVFSNWLKAIIMHIASVFLGTGVTYFMSPLDTQIIEKNIKRWFEHLPSNFC